MKMILRRTVLSLLFAFIIITFFGCNNESAQEQSHDMRLTKTNLVLPGPIDAADIDEIRNLIKTGTDLNLIYKHGLTPLLFASYKGNPKVVKMLLDAKADVNKARSKDDGTPLFLASQVGHIEVVKLLLKAKAKVNKQGIMVLPH